MANLHQFPAKICYTAAAFLIDQKKILFIKHKKIGIWFAPGGHMEPNEVLHVTAERECLEESGIAVKAYDPYFTSGENYYTSPRAEYLPSPILTNLHWVSKDNFEARQRDPKNYQPKAPWLKGCEQHLGFTYLVRPIKGMKVIENTEETDGIGWFSLKELDTLDTTDDIRFEAAHAFRLLGLA